ncbi:glycosyltransferase [Sphingomonas psychrotolerans]|uniref:Mannosyltransferase n=1 Tax=Sphingomonas psychrotolerans TaxID=1327635 RepID=A0A2K8MF23_9SPHN|nr:glycosyltransferase [Sphingomonas psychrotolerans]ATY32477.1 mannosyltransferase [Sphingomonas psychrotolerans]
MIPKLMHFIWVGDQSKCPTNCMDTWRALNPDWEFLLWGNQDLAGQDWFNRDHMNAMHGVELNGVADMMRWEILHAKGGVVVDADSIALRPLDDHLLDCEAFACWESEIARPGLIAAGYFGCEAGNPFVEQIIRDIHDSPSVTHAKAWKTVGPQRLTDSYRKYGYSHLRIYPSHYFIPRHFTGVAYEGGDPVYADQLWGSTLRAYDEIHKREVPAPAAAPVPEVSALEVRNAPYFVQRVQVSNELEGLGRGVVLGNFCEGKRVLHVGCADWPITNLKASLHLALEQVCAQLDGVDPHTEALDQLAPHVKGRLFSSLDQVSDSYDLVLVPEVMEHVPNVSDFLAQLEKVDAGAFLVSVPDAFQCGGRHFDYLADSATFVEVVHPDHNVWYTPYTLTNTIRKYSGLRIEQMWFFNKISLLALLSKEQMRLAA